MFEWALFRKFGFISAIFLGIWVFSRLFYRKSGCANIRKLIVFSGRVRSAFCVVAIAMNLVLVGCQSSKQLEDESTATARATDSVLLRNKDANQNSKEREATSIKDEFIKAVKKRR